MNTPMLPNDDDIEALLADDSDLLKRYRALPQSEPGKHLDAAILGRASNAVRRPVARQRWLIPVASAASLVVAAGVGWRIHLAQQQEQAATTAPAARYDVMEIDLQSSDDKRALDTAVMPPEMQREQAAGGATAPMAKEARPTLSDIITGPARDNGVIVEPHTTADHAEPGRAPEQRQAFPGAMSEGILSSQAAPSAAAPVAADATSDTDGAGKADKLERVDVTGARRKRGASEDEASAEAFGNASQDRAEASTSALAPADWIERIRILISARRVGQAREEIQRFRAAYPSYRLPPDVRRYER